MNAEPEDAAASLSPVPRSRREPVSSGKEIGRFRVLIVDDDPGTLVDPLSEQGYIPLVATGFDHALDLLRYESPDVVLADVGISWRSGYSLCRMIRYQSDVPIIATASENDERFRARDIEGVADDLLVRPFTPEEMVKRVDALLLTRTLPAVIRAGALYVDTLSRDARINGKDLLLPRLEFDLLCLLAAYPGRVFDRQTLLERVWHLSPGMRFKPGARTVDVHIRWLREKVEIMPNKPRIILTVRGVGYKLALEPEA